MTEKGRGRRGIGFRGSGSFPDSMTRIRFADGGITAGSTVGPRNMSRLYSGGDDSAHNDYPDMEEGNPYDTR
jgi:hypothetical protein